MVVEAPLQKANNAGDHDRLYDFEREQTNKVRNEERNYRYQ